MTERVTGDEARGDGTTDRPAFVLLEDGAWFAGTTARALDPAFGEVVFTTNITGYQETFTDPSYLGQIVVMTAPMIGNYGINQEDMESERPQVSGVVVRELSREPSNWRATLSLDDWLAASGVPVIEGVDTRRLTRHLRERGAMRGLIAEGQGPTPELTARRLILPLRSLRSPLATPTPPPTSHPPQANASFWQSLVVHSMARHSLAPLTGPTHLWRSPTAGLQTSVA